MRKKFQANVPKKQAGVAIQIFNETNFQLTVFKRDGKGHLTFIKARKHQEELSVLNIYAPNAMAFTFVKKFY